MMVWLAKWIRENRPDARVLIITDRTELDEQIEKVFLGVNEDIYRTQERRGPDRQAQRARTPSLICSLVHKFGGKEDGEGGDDSHQGFIEEMKKLCRRASAPRVTSIVFVDECHRTQSGDLHRAMKAHPAQCDLHRLHRHAAPESGQAEEHRGVRALHPHLQVRRGGARRASCWTCATRPATSTSRSPRRRRSTSGSRRRRRA